MTTKDAILGILSSTQGMLPMYVSDFSDADLLVRPVPGANHTAWQLGHLISSEISLLKDHIPAKYPDLPAGFADLHSRDSAGEDANPGFLTKDKYVELYGQVREATKAAVGQLSDADFDKHIKGPLEKMAPTLGSLLILNSNHTLMHAGQFSVIRRKLGKPVLF